MTEIYVDPIGTSRYAPQGSDSVNLYRMGENGPSLTLAQLVAAVSIRTAVVLERRSAINLSRLVGETDFSEALSSAVKMLTSEATKPNSEDFAVTWDSVLAPMPEGYEPRSSSYKVGDSLKKFLLYECGIDESKLPKDLTTAKNKLDAYVQVKAVMENVSRTSQMQQIEAKSAITRRDVCYSTAANTMGAICATKQNTAAAMKR